MYECVILFRNTLNGKVGFVSDAEEEDDIAVFANFDSAETATRTIPICRAYPWQIVELDEI